MAAITPRKRAGKGGKRAGKGENRLRRNLKKRKQLWPNLKKEMIWDWKEKNGFSTVPRTLPYFFRIMDSFGKRLSPVYLALWCRNWDRSCLIRIKNQRELAWESGYLKQRGINMWRDRMRKLRELGFIETKPLGDDQFYFVLLVDPYYVVKNLKKSGKYTDEGWLNALIERSESIGASGLDDDEED